MIGIRSSRLHIMDLVARTQQLSVQLNAIKAARPSDCNNIQKHDYISNRKISTIR
jgi:hypothetical protein